MHIRRRLILALSSLTLLTVLAAVPGSILQRSAARSHIELAAVTAPTLEVIARIQSGLMTVLNEAKAFTTLHLYSHEADSAVTREQTLQLANSELSEMIEAEESVREAVLDYPQLVDSDKETALLVQLNDIVERVIHGADAAILSAENSPDIETAFENLIGLEELEDEAEEICEQAIHLKAQEVDRAQVEAEEQQSLVLLVAWSVAILGALIAGLIGVPLLRSISQPLWVLLQATEGLRSGDLSCRAGLEGPGEFAQLGASFDEMAEKLQVNRNELETALGAAENANSAMHNFLANTSHELRTPMNGILGMLTVLRDSGLDESQQECVELVERSGKAMLTIVTDILDLRRFTSDHVTADARDFDLRSLLRSTCALLEPEAHRKGLELHLDLAADIPSVVCGDPAQLRLAIGHLLTNAIKFSDEGEIRVGVTTMMRSDEGLTLLVSVDDNGIGIDASLLPHIFDAFRQGNSSSSRQYGGLGIGLAIVKGIVDSMGARVEILARPEGGTSARILLELSPPNGDGATVDAEHDCPTMVAEVASASSEHREGLAVCRDAVENDEVRVARVLVVDDNVINQRVATALLRKCGCETDLASDGREGVELATDHAYDVIFMDCQMPVLDGYEATAKIRLAEGTERHTPIIALTGHAMVGDRAKCLAAGMDDYVTKPVQLSDLQCVLRNWLPVSNAVDDPIADVT